jgi:hypothetical protein
MIVHWITRTDRSNHCNGLRLGYGSQDPDAVTCPDCLALLLQNRKEAEV